MTKNELVANLRANRWYQDRYESWKFSTENGTEFRIKLNKYSVRFEVKDG